MTDDKKLWEILVPTVSNEGKPFRLRYHRVWDAHVRKISGGMTILPVAKGQWLDGDKVYAERMIPVRILATRDQMEQIVEYTMRYYHQLAVLAYKISDEVILKRCELKSPKREPKTGKSAPLNHSDPSKMN